MEARVGFEPTNGGFADLSLRPLGYRAESKQYNEIIIDLSGPHGGAGVPPAVFADSLGSSQLLMPMGAYRKAGTTCASRINRADSSGGVGQI